MLEGNIASDVSKCTAVLEKSIRVLTTLAARKPPLFNHCVKIFKGVGGGGQQCGKFCASVIDLEELEGISYFLIKVFSLK